jgi:hypothetical protein
MKRYIAFPDASAAGRARFDHAADRLGVNVIRESLGPPRAVLIETDDPDAFARACGTTQRPIVVDPAPVASPS